MIIEIFSILLGLAIGSFLNVCIYRLPLKKSIISPRSFCPNCERKLKFYDNVPLISFILLKGKCRHCKAPISFQYPLVEALSGFLFWFTYKQFGISWQTLAQLLLFSSLLAIFFIDLKHQVIPDVITLPGIALGLLFSLLTKTPPILYSLLGVVLGGGLFFLTAILGEFIFKKESLGGGDIKLAAMLGAFLGWKMILLIFFLSALLGSLIGIITLFISAKVKKTRAIPFGPFLALATFLAIFWGERLIQLYLQLVFRY